MEEKLAQLAELIKSVNNTSDQVVELSDQDIKMIQKLLLSVFDDILDICNTHHIRYQMGGGSALGAVRHHGFIPWDDDIDINMYRSDVNKFLIEFKKKYGNKYWLHIPGETENYDFLMIKIISKQVYVKELLDSAYDGECGFAIDIFIIENEPDNKLIRKLFQARCMLGRYILSCLRFKNSKNELLKMAKGNNEFLKIIRKRIRLGRLLSFKTVSSWEKKIEKWCSSCKDENSKYVGIASGRKQINKETYLREDLKTQEAEFEGRKVKIAKNYSKYLENLYGRNFMQVPPIEKREKHVVMKFDRNALEKSVQLLGK